MDLTVAKKDLLRLAKRTVAIANGKSTSPILANALLEADAEGLTVKATDLTLSVRSTAPAEVRKTGSVAVNAKDLTERVAAMPDGPVLVSVTDAKLTLKAAGSARRYTLASVPGSEYPVLPEPPAEAQRLTLSAERLLRTLAGVAYAISTDDTRPNVNGLLLEWTGETLRAVATDGHRLSLLESAHQSETSGKALLPLRGVLELRRLAEEARSSESAVVTLTVGEREAYLEAAGATFGTKLVEAVFPSYAKVIPPSDGRKKATVPRAALADAVKAVSLAANDRTGGIRLTFEASRLVVASESPASGDGSDEVPADYDGPGLIIGVNAKYIQDVLAALETNDVEVVHGGDLDPLTLFPVGSEGETFTAVVMPIRLLSHGPPTQVEEASRPPDALGHRARRRHRCGRAPLLWTVRRRADRLRALPRSRPVGARPRLAPPL